MNLGLLPHFLWSALSRNSCLNGTAFIRKWTSRAGPTRIVVHHATRPPVAKVDMTPAARITIEVEDVVSGGENPRLEETMEVAPPSPLAMAQKEERHDSSQLEIRPGMGVGLRTVDVIKMNVTPDQVPVTPIMLAEIDADEKTRRAAAVVSPPDNVNDVNDDRWTLGWGGWVLWVMMIILSGLVVVVVVWRKLLGKVARMID